MTTVDIYADTKSPRAKTARKPAAKKPAAKKPAAKKPAARKTISAYDRGIKNGWGFLIETMSREAVRKLKAM